MDEVSDTTGLRLCREPYRSYSINSVEQGSVVAMRDSCEIDRRLNSRKDVVRRIEVVVDHDGFGPERRCLGTHQGSHGQPAALRQLVESLPRPTTAADNGDPRGDGMYPRKVRRWYLAGVEICQRFSDAHHWTYTKSLSRYR